MKVNDMERISLSKLEEKTLQWFEIADTLRKGEPAGHEFRGNQYTGGKKTAGVKKAKKKVKTVPASLARLIDTVPSESNNYTTASTPKGVKGKTNYAKQKKKVKGSPKVAAKKKKLLNSGLVSGGTFTEKFDRYQAAKKAGFEKLFTPVTKAVKSMSKTRLNTLAKTTKNTLSADDNGIVDAYTGSGYQAINESLRGHPDSKGKTIYTSNSNVPLTVEAASARMDKAFANGSVALGKETVFFRGVGTTSTKLKNLKVGSTFTDKGFVSSTIQADTAYDFAKSFAEGNDHYVFRIICPKGTKVLPIGNARQHSEGEAILPKGLKFKVVHRETVDMPHSMHEPDITQPFHAIELEVIP